MKKLIIASVFLSVASLASAKLPPPSDEAKSKAAEAAAKAAWSSKVAAYQSCKSQDRAAAHYYKTAKNTKPAQATAPCVDPGAFSYVPAVEGKPAEVAGATAASTTATNSPDGKTSAAAVAPAKKP